MSHTGPVYTLAKRLSGTHRRALIYLLLAIEEDDMIDERARFRGHPDQYARAQTHVNAVRALRGRALATLTNAARFRGEIQPEPERPRRRT